MKRVINLAIGLIFEFVLILSLSSFLFFLLLCFYGYHKSSDLVIFFDYKNIALCFTFLMVTISEIVFIYPKVKHILTKKLVLLYTLVINVGISIAVVRLYSYSYDIIKFGLGLSIASLFCILMSYESKVIKYINKNTILVLFIINILLSLGLGYLFKFLDIIF